jgi:hypothetical protein
MQTDAETGGRARVVLVGDFQEGEMWVVGLDPGVDDCPYDALAVRGVGPPGRIGLDRGGGAVDLGLHLVVRPDPEDHRWSFEPLIQRNQLGQLAARHHRLVKAGGNSPHTWRQALLLDAGQAGYAGPVP